MSLISRILAWLSWDTAPVEAGPRVRRLRATCEFCGKDIAIIASSGKLWNHRCKPPAPLEEEPADALQHDTWDEHRGLR